MLHLLVLLARLNRQPSLSPAMAAQLRAAAAAARAYFNPAPPDVSLGHIGSYTPLKPQIALLVLKHWDKCESLDPQGIPVDHYQVCPVDDVPPRDWINPGSVALFALRLYDLDFGPGHRWLPLFLRESHWLLSHQLPNGDIPVPFAIPMLGLKAGWVSAMYQGLALSVFLRAYALTHDRAYLTAADRVVASFTLPYGHGGFVAETPYGPWPQEYPAAKPPSVLNGGISALIGLLEYERFTGHTVPLLSRYLATLDRMLPAFDVPGWVRYQLAGDDYAAPFYMAVHVEELRVLYDFTANPTFREYAERWESDFLGPNVLAAAERRMLAGVVPH